MGLDQGRACAAELRERFEALSPLQRLAWRLGVAAPPSRPLARELSRHFPHQAEALAGLAVGAGVPAAWLAEQLGAELRREAATLPVGLATTGAVAGVARALDGPWLLRRSRPEGLFASLELTRPWLPNALLGVNERGLAVAVVAGEAADVGAPGALLAQDCLERFEALEAALEWCEGRPGAGRAVVLVADACGDAAGIEIGSGRRRVLRPEGGLVAGGGAPGEAAERIKSLAQAAPVGVEELARVIPGGGAAALAGERRLAVGGDVFSL